MYFKLLLNGAEFTGMDSAELEKEYERSIKERGFLTKYSRDVEFLEDAYDYLTKLARVNPCESVDIIIQARGWAGQPWANFLEGVILLRDMKIDLQRCKIKTSIKDTSVFGIFFEMKDFELNMEVTESLNGVVSLTNPITDIHAFFNPAGSLIIATNVDYAKAYPIFDTIDFILQYISDGRLTLVSDYLSSGGHWLEYRLSFVTTPILGETVTVTITDFKGNIGIATVVSDGNTTNFANEMRAAIILASNRTTCGVNRIITAFPAGSTIHLRMFCNENIPTFDVTTSGATVINESVQEDYTRNASGWYVSDGYRLTNRDNTPGVDDFQISFDTLFQILAKSRDLSYTIEKSGGDYQLRIEPIEYFFDNSVTLSLEGARDVEIEFIDDRLRSSLLLGKEGGGGYSSFLFETLNCGGTIDLLKGKNLRYSTTEIFDHISGAVDYEGDLFIVKCYADPAFIIANGYDTPVQFVTQEIANPAIPGTVTDNYVYNAGLEAGNILQDFTFFAPDRIFTSADEYQMTYNAGPQPLVVTAVADPYIGNRLQYLQRARFTYPIKFSDFQAIDSRSVISFNTKGGAYIEGHIEIMKYKAVTASTEFILILKELA